jgi:hypothetical protein
MLEKSGEILNILNLSVFSSNNNLKQCIMKGSKLVVILLFLSGNVTLMGQINPVNNLEYQQLYAFGNPNCPAYNCFTLSWQVPEISNDTLIGYRIFRNGQLYAFTNDVVFGCGGAAPCTHDDWYSMLPFWATVKAVYNHDSVESIVTDSVHVNDLAIYIKENEKQDFSLAKNPIRAGDNISLVVPGINSEKLVVNIISPAGKVLKVYEVSNGSKSVVCFPSTGLERGLYYITVAMQEKKISLKLLVE